MPAFSEIAGVKPSEDIYGISFLAVLQGNEHNQEVHEYLYWEFPVSGGQQAVRMDKWKELRKNITREGNLEIELYNLEEDIQEQVHVANQHPDTVTEMELIMGKEHTVPELERFRMQALMDKLKQYIIQPGCLWF